MGGTDICRLYQSWQFARRFKNKAVIEHLDLNLSSFDVVRSMATGIYGHLLYHELRIVATSNELAMLSEERMLTYLCLQILNRLLDLIQDGSLKGDILDDVHLCTHLLVNTFVSDKTGTATREKLLRVLAKEQDTGDTDILLTFVVGRHKVVVLAQVLHWRLSISQQLGIVSNGIHVNVINRGTIDSCVLIRTLAFVVHQLQTLLEC